MISVACTYCGQVHNLPDEAAGRVIPCAACQLTILVPRPAAARAEEPAGVSQAVPAPPPKAESGIASQSVAVTPSQRGSPSAVERPAPSARAVLNEAAVEFDDDRTEPCYNHRSLPATVQCQRCQEAFCDLCVVKFQGQQLCGRCKDRAVSRLRQSAKSSALCYVSLVVALPALLWMCAGIVCGPVAVVLGVIGLKKVEDDPQARGRAWAWSGILLGAYSFFLAAMFYFRFFLFDRD